MQAFSYSKVLRITLGEHGWKGKESSPWIRGGRGESSLEMQTMMKVFLESNAGLEADRREERLEAERRAEDRRREDRLAEEGRQEARRAG